MHQSELKLMKAIARKILHFFGLEGISRILFLESDLKENGWFLSVKTKESVDKDGLPIPWVTYPFIDFIDARINKDMTVFEFGAGNSSIYFANKTKSVTSIEHSPEWFEIIKSNDIYNKENLDIHLVEIPERMNKQGYHKMAFIDDVNDYVFSLKNTGKKFDVVIVDGLFRNSCIKHCLDSLTPGGVVFLDNTSKHYRDQLKIGTDFMKENGFRRLDFSGMGPIYSRKSCTTIFYRDDNCFNI